MEEDGEYADGEIVWVKLSYCWWPGEVLAGSRLTDEFLSTLKRRPLAVVKFFDEDSYEYVKNTNFIYKYNCSRKHEFLRKGLEQYRAKNKHMVKFPADVMQAERATGGDPNIVNSTEFLPQKRESYADIFSPDKSKGGKGKASATTPRGGSPKKAAAISPSKIIPVIPVRKHEVRILGQASSPSGIASRSSLLSTPNNSSLNASTSSSVGEPGSSAPANVSAASPSQIYHCHKCGFESSRQNVIVLHTKYCRAVPLAPFNIPAVRESKSLQSTTARTTTLEDPVTPKAAPKLPDEPPQQPPAAAPADEEELVEVIQVVEEKTPAAVGRSSRTPRTAAKAATPTPKVDRRKNRGGRGKAVATPVVEVEAVAADEEKVEVLQVSEEEPPAEEVVPAPEVGKGLDDSTGKDSKGKADVELKNELLADWSEDEQDEQELKEDKRKAASSDESEKVESTEKAAPVISITDSSAEKSVESSPQLASPVSSSSGTTIKYRNIPKKQKREFIEVTNDQPATTQAVTIEKSSSESSISTAATCGDKTASSSSADSLPEQSRPLSAKQRILDRATRGSSKSNSSSTEELKPVIVATTTASAESQHDSASTSDETKKDIASCFDFKEEEEEEVVLSKSPRRSLSNRRDVSLDAKQEQEELERAKKDAELKNEIDSLLNEVSVPSLPDLPKLPVSPRATSPGPSQEIISPQSKEEIDRNRTLPPKERGKRIFKTRNKPTVENEAIALEQSKAIVLDFVKKSHEEEEAQQQQEAKLSSESPTTTNDDSQESVLSAVATEPQRFENSEFAAIKAKRAKLPVEEEPPKEEESTVSSSNEEPKPATAEQPDSLPVSISKDQLTLEVLEITTPSPKSRKGKQQPLKQTIVSPIVLIEKLPEPVEEEQQSEVTPKATSARKKRAGEMDQLDLTALDTPRSRRGRSAKVEEPTPEPEPPKEIEAAAPVEKRKAKRGKKEEEVPAVDETPEVEPKPSKSKRSKQSQQRSADSTADLHAEVDPVVPTSVEPAPEEPVVREPVPIVEPVVAKHQPIKMIIKSKGKKSNSELIYDDPVVAPEPKPEETQEKLPKSPKSSKRKKEEPAVEPPAEETVEPLAKSPKSKRPKVKASEKPKEPEVSVGGPSATDLQVAEALIQLPEAPVIPPKAAVVDDQEMVEVKSNNSSPVHSKTINPRKRHLQKLMDTAEVIVEQPPPEIVTIPEKKKRETIVEVVSVAPASIVQDLPAKTTNVVVASVPPPDEDKFDIDNIPIVMDDSELLEDSTISTTSNTGRRSTVTPVEAPVDEDVKLISTTKPMTKKIVIVKSSNGSAKIVGRKESPAVAKKNLAIKSTTITIKPPLDQLSPTNVTTRSPAASPTPMRSAQLVQASSGGQIVITSKGTVLTTQSPSTSTARSHSSDGLKTHVSQSHSKPAIVSSVVSSASSISSSSSSSSSATKELPESAANSTPQRPGTGAAAAIKSPAKICVQSQEIIHPATKPRPVASSPVVVQKVTTEVGQQHKKGLAVASASSQKKSSGKKQAEPGTSGGKPLFATSKGALITSQPATTSSVNPGKKNHRVIKISPQKLKEFTRLGMVEDKGKGKVLTASGMKKFRQEQEQLLQQQQQQQEPQSKPDKPIQRADSIDEEPSTSTPTPPPPADAPAEVVVAAAADSSVKELPPASPVEPEQSPEVAEEEPAKPEEIVEENEAAAAETEPECSSSSKVEPVPAAEEASESASAQPEVPAEATSESSSNVQESSQLIAVPAENFGGPANLFYLCSVREEGFVPVNNELLYLDSSNQLVALPEQASVEDIVQQAAGQEVLEIPAGEHAAVDVEGAVEAGQQNILLNTQDGQQIILDQQSLMALAAAGADTSQLLTPDGQQIVLQGSAQELLAALAVTQPGLGIAVAAEGTQIIVAPESLIDLQDAPLPGEIIQVNPNTTVETNAVLTKPPIMSTVEVPSKNGNGTTDAGAADKALDPVATTNLDESLAAVIGVPGNPNVPTSLELPITVTNPVIAKTTTCKINPIYPTTTAIAAIPGVLDLPPTALAQTDPSTSIKSVWD